MAYVKKKNGPQPEGNGWKEERCLVCSQVLTVVTTKLRSQDEEESVRTRSKESLEILDQVARFLQVTATIYRETDLDALPKIVLCASCHEAVSSGLELQEALSKLQVQLQILREMIKGKFIRSYVDDSNLENVKCEDGEDALKKIRKTYAQCWTPCMIRLQDFSGDVVQKGEQSGRVPVTVPFQLFDVASECEGIKLEIELHPDQFPDYDGPSGIPEEDQLGSVIIPEEINVKSEYSSFGEQFENSEFYLRGLHEEDPLSMPRLNGEGTEENWIPQDLDMQDPVGELNQEIFPNDWMSSAPDSIMNTFEETGSTLESIPKSEVIDLEDEPENCNTDTDSDPDYTPGSEVSQFKKRRRKERGGMKGMSGSNNQGQHNISDSSHGSDEDGAPSPTSDVKSFCSICMKSFKNRPSFASHMRQHENPEELISTYIHTTLDQDKNIIAFGCDLCRQQFWKSNHTISLKSNQVRILCQHGNCSCKAIFRDFKAFIYHHRSICTKAYWSRKPKRNLCQHCGRSFEDERRLINHRNIMHPKSSDDRPGGFTCEICGTKFSNQVILTNHMARCYKPDSLRCQFCSQVCGRLDNLNAHMSVHHPEKILEKLHRQR